MAIPFLTTITRANRRLIPFIRRAVREGMSSRQTESAIRAAGFRVSRSRFIVPALREYNQLERQGRAAVSGNRSRRINTRRLPPATTRIAQQYSYRVRITTMGPDGFPIESYIQVGTDRSDLTGGMLEDMARDMITASPDTYGLDQFEVELETGMQNATLSDFNVTRAGNIIR